MSSKNFIQTDPVVQVDPTHWRELALTCFQSGDYSHTEEILRFLLTKGFEVPSTHCHLTRVLMMVDRDNEAREEIARAWECREKAQSYVLPRILFFHLLFALLDQPDDHDPQKEGEIRQRIAEIKNALHSEDDHREWTMKPVLDHLQFRLTPNAHTFLTTLVSVLGNRQHLPELDSFSLWRESTTI